ncbi:hypothetical protein [Paenibacillus sp. GCM10027626]
MNHLLPAARSVHDSRLIKRRINRSESSEKNDRTPARLFPNIHQRV